MLVKIIYSKKEFNLNVKDKNVKERLVFSIFIVWQCIAAPLSLQKRFIFRNAVHIAMFVSFDRFEYHTEEYLTKGYKTKK